GWCFFRIDLAAPEPPQVTSTVFAACDATQPEDPVACPVQGTIGESGEFAASASDNDVVKYEWSLNDGPATVVATVAGAARSFSVTPTQELNKVTVVAVDGTGKTGSTDYWFKVAPRSPQLH